MKKILSLSLLIIAVFVSVCGANEATKKAAPAEDVSVLCNAVLHFDCDSLQRFGTNLEEYEKSFCDGFNQNLIQSSGIAFTDEQVKKINDAVINLLKRAQFKTETVSENCDSSTVKVTVDTFEKYSDELITANLPANVSSMSEAERIGALADAMANAFNNLKKVNQSEFTVECQYNAENNMWVPVQIENFDSLIFSKVLNF